MTPETLAILTAYFLCSAVAETRPVSQAEALACMDTYTDVKLLFVDGVERSAFDAMSVHEQVEVNAAGYAGYVAWKKSNPELVRSLKLEAALRIAGSES